MADLKLRPRFTRQINAEIACLLQVIGKPDSVESGRDLPESVETATVRGALRTSVIDSSVIIRVPRGSERVWSPQLEVTFEVESNQPGCIMHGQFGPRPSIWTSFVAGYLFFLCAGFVGFMFGMTSYWLGMDARMLWVVPVSAAGMIAVFVIARFGRSLGRDQMSSLYEFLDQSIRDCELDSGNGLQD